MSIFLARLGNRDNHFSRILFLLNRIEVTIKNYIFKSLLTFLVTSEHHNTHCHYHSQNHLCFSMPLTSAVVLFKKYDMCPMCHQNRMYKALYTLTSDLIAAFTAVYSSSAKKTKKIQTPVHKSTA